MALPSLFGANFSKDEDATWSIGDGTGTLGGSAAVTGGKLACLGGETAYVSYPTEGNLGLNTGCIRFKYTPVKSGIPTANSILTFAARENTYFDSISLTHSSINGALVILIRSLATVSINTNFGAWVPVANTEYEFSLNYDLALGGSEVRLFINGTQMGSTITTAAERTAQGEIWFSSDNNQVSVSDAYFDDILLYDEVQHTADYTPCYKVPSMIKVSGITYVGNAGDSGKTLKYRPFELGFINETITYAYEWSDFDMSVTTDGCFYNYIPKNPTDTFWEIKIGKQTAKFSLEDVTDNDVEFSDLTVTFLEAN